MGRGSHAPAPDLPNSNGNESRTPRSNQRCRAAAAGAARRRRKISCQEDKNPSPQSGRPALRSKTPTGNQFQRQASERATTPQQSIPRSWLTSASHRVHLYAVGPSALRANKYCFRPRRGVISERSAAAAATRRCLCRQIAVLLYSHLRRPQSNLSTPRRPFPGRQRLPRH